MDAAKKFIKTTTLGGVIVVLPLAILFIVFSWLWQVITGAIAPITSIIIGDRPTMLVNLLVNVIAVMVILGGCFGIGLAVRTAFGRVIQSTLEDRILKWLPGYKLVKDAVFALLGGGKSPFSHVALVRLFDNDTLVTGFITDEHEDGSYSVFVPTAPNPTSGGVFHLRPEHVTILSQPPDDVMRSIISCGAGSGKLLTEYRQIRSGAQPESPVERPVTGCNQEP